MSESPAPRPAWLLHILESKHVFKAVASVYFHACVAAGSAAMEQAHRRRRGYAEVRCPRPSHALNKADSSVLE
jgi:hypothetical protein